MNMAGVEKARTDDGVAIAYQVVGTGPRVILALHGWGGAGTGHSWREVVRRMDLADLKVVTIDLRGHGESDQPETGFTLERFSRDIFTVADRVGAELFVMVAYSMSARWAQWMSCQFPERVSGQILIAPVPAIALQLGDELLETWMRDTGQREDFGRFVRQFTAEPLCDEIVDDYFRDVSRASDFAKRETFRMCCRDDFSPRLGATRAPTFVLAGSQDPMLSPAFLRQEIVERIPGARLVQMNCGHEIPVERPAETAALIEAFLAGLSGNSSSKR